MVNQVYQDMTVKSKIDAAELGDGIKAFLLDALFPVGSIVTRPTSPAAVFGGTWEQVKDKFIMAAGDIYPAGSTGGSATHSLTVEELPSHKPALATGSGDYEVGGYIDETTTRKDFYGDSKSILPIGGNQPFSILPPYQAAIKWQRTL